MTAESAATSDHHDRAIDVQGLGRLADTLVAALQPAVGEEWKRPHAEDPIGVEIVGVEEPEQHLRLKEARSGRGREGKELSKHFNPGGQGSRIPTPAPPMMALLPMKKGRPASHAPDPDRREGEHVATGGPDVRGRW